MLDGRHTGTGGGNHIVVGGATPPDSPFLRRPDLLKSLVIYWQNHPSLSYLFSGLFIGPTSQAPRIDEARHDSLYELEIAFAQIPRARTGSSPPPWLVDRLFRNLLVDVTGNTHRAEICIDKLYSPDGPTGRLGLVEFRGFEMPPHARMSLAQQLLLRAPDRAVLARPAGRAAGALGHLAARPFHAAAFRLAGLPRRARRPEAPAIAFDAEWFKPQSEFRFPVLGAVEYEGVELELRQAIEPWHVLGENRRDRRHGALRRFFGGTAAGQADDGLTGSLRRRLQRAPRAAAPTGDAAAKLSAAVRFKAWQPAMACIRRFRSHAPLVFDIFDTWSGRSIGGCAYHVAHPGGRNYETFPVNGNEAEARRLARFEARGHTPGAYQPPPESPACRISADLGPEAPPGI